MWDKLWAQALPGWGAFSVRLVTGLASRCGVSALAVQNLPEPFPPEGLQQKQVPVGLAPF